MHVNFNPSHNVSLHVLSLFAILSVLTMFSPCWAATYYVDATNGNDSNPGTSQSTPWKSIAKVNNSSFLPGEQILFKREEIWRETLKVPSSGTEQNSIAFGAYGVGNLPVITALDIVKVWELETGYVYRFKKLSRLPRVLVLDGVLGNRRTTKADLSSNGDWYFDQARDLLFIYSETDPGLRLIEIGHRDYCIQDNNAGYITVENLKLSGANCAWGGAIDIRGTAGPWTVRSCFVTNSNSNGIMLVNSGSLLFGNVISHVGNYGIHIHAECNNSFVAKNEISYCHAGIAIVGKSNVFESNLIHHNDWNGIYLEGRPSQGSSADYNTVRYNRIHNNGNSAFFGDETNGAEIYNAGADNNKFYYNVIYDGSSKYACGIWFDFGSSYNQVYNNTIYSMKSLKRGYGLHIENGDEGGRSVGNDFKNNIITGCRIQLAVANDIRPDLQNNVFEFNCYHSVSKGYAIYDGTDRKFKTLPEWKASHPASNAHSISSDPQFVDLTSRNFALKTSSPCLNVGTNVGLYRDFEGHSVPQEGKVDMGAFQHQLHSPVRNLSVLPF